MEEIIYKIANRIPSHMDMDYVGHNIVEISSKKNGIKPCMMLSFKKRSGDWTLEIEYLKYLPHQKECQISGNDLLKWVKSLCDLKIVKHTVLTDSSFYEFPNTNVSIDLTPFSKFTNGVGWYESHGFLPKSSSENRMYQQSFLKLKNNNTKNICNLAYYFMKPFLTLDANKELKFSFSDINYNKINNEHYVSVKKYLRKFTTNEFSNSIIERMSEKHKYVFIYILERFGVLLSNNEIKKLNSYEYQVYSSIHKLVDNSTCILKTFTPGSTRKLVNKIMENTKTSLTKDEYYDMLNYMSFLNDFIKCMTNLTILYTPSELTYPNTKKTYKQSKKRCVVSYKKHSKK